MYYGRSARPATATPMTLARRDPIASTETDSTSNEPPVLAIVVLGALCWLWLVVHSLNFLFSRFRLAFFVALTARAALELSRPSRGPGAGARGRRGRPDSGRPSLGSRLT